jgi:hypothetical protein
MTDADLVPGCKELILQRVDALWAAGRDVDRVNWAIKAMFIGVSRRVMMGLCLFEIGYLTLVTPSRILNNLPPCIVVNRTPACPCPVISCCSTRECFARWSIASSAVEMGLRHGGICPVNIRVMGSEAVHRSRGERVASGICSGFDKEDREARVTFVQSGCNDTSG